MNAPGRPSRRGCLRRPSGTPAGAGDQVLGVLDQGTAGVPRVGQQPAAGVVLGQAVALHDHARGHVDRAAVGQGLERAVGQPPGSVRALSGAQEGGRGGGELGEHGLVVVGERPGGGGSLASVIYASRAPRSAETSVRLSGEHSDYRWVTTDEWLTLPSWWSREAILGVSPAVDGLPETEPPEPPTPQSPESPEVVANLGAGTVLVDDTGSEPRALLMRRRKPPVGLWENPGGMLEPGEDFFSAAARETLEETGLKAEPRLAWWARVEPWQGPSDHKLYAGVGFVCRHPGGEIRIEEEAHDDYLWATREQWETLRTWYTPSESRDLWGAVERLTSTGQRSDEA